MVVVSSPGRVIVDSTVLAGSCVVIVEETPGSVKVVVVIWPGCVKVSTTVSGGDMLTDVTVSCGKVRVDTMVETTVLGGIWVVIVEISPSAVVVVVMTWGGKVRVLSCVDTSVTVSSTVCVGPGIVTGTLISTVRSDVKTTVCGIVCVNVVVIKISEKTVSVITLVVPDRVRVDTMNSVDVDVDTDVDTLVVRDVVVTLTTSVVVVGRRLMKVSTGPGTETVSTEV